MIVTVPGRNRWTTATWGVAMGLALGGLSACSNSPGAGPADRAPAASTPGLAISGRVTLDGTAPPLERIRFDADPQCQALSGGESQDDAAVLVSTDRGLQNVFVHVTDGLPPPPYPAPAETVVLDQQSCRYTPRVLGVQAGQTLILRNSDPVLHTVRGDAARNPRFDIATPVQGLEIPRVFQTPEVMVPVKCDMHPWMTAFVGVVAHPYFAVTDAAGRFAITGLPSGSYVLEFWHERFGTRTGRIRVTGDEAAEVNVTYVSAR